MSKLQRQYRTDNRKKQIFSFYEGGKLTRSIINPNKFDLGSGKIAIKERTLRYGKIEIAFNGKIYRGVGEFTHSLNPKDMGVGRIPIKPYKIPCITGTLKNDLTEEEIKTLFNSFK